ncbi:MAG: GAF domain-containing protein [Candidatus Aminicenantia bacterium]
MEEKEEVFLKEKQKSLYHRLIIAHRALKLRTEKLKKVNEELSRSNKELSILYHISKTISQSLALEEMLKDTFDKIIELMEFKGGSVGLIDEENKNIEFIIHRGLSKEFIENITQDKVKIGEGYSGQVAQTGQIVFVEDISKDSRLTRPLLKKEGVKSLISIPLKAKDKVFGVMTVFTHRLRYFSSKDLKLLLSVGNQLGIAIENSKLYQKLKEKLEESEKMVSFMIDREVKMVELKKEIEELRERIKD